MTTGSRQLAAIMFTDMVGYTALMQTDERQAREKQVRHKEVFDKCVREFHGKTLQYYGDGTLSIFSSTIECVSCAVKIQQQLLQAPKVDLRIGIHVGDITLEADGIYGDGVNIASRIESLAVPGGIFISEKVFDDIRNQKDIRTRDIGYFDLKNVQQPVHIFAIANEGLAIPSREEIKGKMKQPVNSLAVLPFVNLSGDPDNEYFSDGITEELLNALTAVEGLRVTSRTSSFALKGKSEDIREIATKLNVEKLLEGSVRKSGNRVRITAQLINAADGFHIWSETYDRDLTDIFKVQDEISQIIANKLRAKLSAAQKGQMLVTAPTENLEAYSVFLKGKYFHHKETPPDVLKAVEYYNEAIALEPDFALAHAYLAGAYALLGSLGIVNAGEADQQVHYHSNKAIALDEKLSVGYVAKGAACLFFDWKWDEAYRSLMKAMELNKGATEVHWVLGYYYLIMNETKQAVDVLETAWQLDPLSMVIARTLSMAYFYAERYDDVIRLADMQLAVMPGMWYASALKGFAIGKKGNWDEALKIFIEANQLSQGSPLTLSYLAYGYGKVGKIEEAKKFVRHIEDFQQAHPELAKNEDLMLAWLGAGDIDKAYEYLFKAIERREELVTYMLNSPIYSGLKSDPRFEVAKKQMNL